MSGLSRTPGKRVWVNSPPRVRIPLPPPRSGFMRVSGRKLSPRLPTEGSIPTGLGKTLGVPNGHVLRPAIRFGRSARNCRFARSSGHGAFVSGMVVRTRLPPVAPCQPWRRIKRSTVQRATKMPSR